MRITSKGQVTIPIDVREKAGLLPHTEVEFELRRDVVILRKPARRVRRRLAEAGRAEGSASSAT